MHPETGQYYVNYHLEGGGWGGRSFADGNNALIVPNGNCRNTPVEVFETRYTPAVNHDLLMGIYDRVRNGVAA